MKTKKRPTKSLAFFLLFECKANRCPLPRLALDINDRFMRFQDVLHFRQSTISSTTANEDNIEVRKRKEIFHL